MEVVFVIKKNVSNPGVNLLITWDSTGYNEQKLIWGSLSKKGDFVLKVRECVIKSKGRHTNYGLNSNQGMGVHRRSLCVGLCTLAQSSFCGGLHCFFSFFISETWRRSHPVVSFPPLRREPHRSGNLDCISSFLWEGFYWLCLGQAYALGTSEYGLGKQSHCTKKAVRSPAALALLMAMGLGCGLGIPRAVRTTDPLPCHTQTLFFFLSCI